MVRQSNVWMRKTANSLGIYFVSMTMAWSAEIPGGQLEYFEKHVRPLLESRCLECHSARGDEIAGNLRLDSRSGWMRGGDLGPAIVPGHPDQSLLLQAVHHTHPDLQMPPDGKLSDNEIRVLVEWIRSGAADPRSQDEELQLPKVDIAKGREHWAFQSPHGKPQPLPHVVATWWPANAIDFFILSELERRGLQPAARAERSTLIRRATFDLLGLPPTPEEVEAFLNDPAETAYEDLIDRLLSSPRYGERWGRFWLDVARYADSNGLDENIAHGNAWRFRDYVIASFNRDTPYDTFVREQIAGDLLPAASRDAGVRQTIATGFLSLGPKVLAEVDETKMEMDIIDEQVETVGRAFMGLTLGCARCHDHKFDPISTEDYYALAGIFKSTKTMEHFTKIARWNEANIGTESERAQYTAHAERVAAKKKQIEQRVADAKQHAGEEASEKEFDEATRSSLKKLRRELAQLKLEAPEVPHAMAVTEYDEPTDLHVHIRGSAHTLGAVARRAVPAVFVTQDSDRIEFGKAQSGRSELAEWLVDGRHPLVARVMVNRLWRWHFGRGLAASTDNFGQLGERPLNQPLLDWLAVRFVNDGWSIKRIHRLIMLSSTYCMSSQQCTANEAVDEQNQLHWRADIKRLEAEAIRDAILHVSGRLDLTAGGSLLHVKNREFLFDHTSKDSTKYDSPRRSVYLPVIRNHLYDVFQLFDYSNASVMSSNRATTTVAPQALFLMNSDLVAESAVGFANRVCRQHEDDAERIRLAYLLAFGRAPTDAQRARALRYLEQFRPQSGPNAANPPSDDVSWRYLCQALLMSNEFTHIH